MSAEAEVPLDVLGQGNLILSSDTRGCNRKVLQLPVWF